MFMMIDGTNWYVQSQNGAVVRVRNVGVIAEEAFDGTLLTVLNDTFIDPDGWETVPLTPAQAAAFFVYHDGNLHNVSGDAFGGATLTALVVISSYRQIRYADSSFRVIFTFSIRPT